MSLRMRFGGVLQGVHAQGDVHSRAVGEEGSQGGLHKQAEDQDSVPVEQKIRSQKKAGSTKVQGRTAQANRDDQTLCPFLSSQTVEEV